MAITQSISSLGTPPSTSDPENFAPNADTFLGTALPNLRTEINTWAGQANALAAAMNAVAAGTALSIPMVFSTTTTDADPGAGYLRLDNATQNSATTIRTDLLGSDGSDWTAVQNLFDDSTSTIKGFITLKKVSDATKFLIFSVSSLASPSGYKNITVACVAYSAASPFANNDDILLEFTRNGDKGDSGGDFSSNTATSVDGEVVLFSGTGGKTGKRATGTGLATLASGVLGTAASGTDVKTINGSSILGSGDLTVGGSWIYLSTVTASASATVDIETTFDSTYASYAIVGTGIISSTNSDGLNIRLKIGGSYVTTSYHGSSIGNDSNSATPYAAISNNAGFLDTGSSFVSSNSGYPTSITLIVSGPVSSTSVVQSIQWQRVSPATTPRVASYVGSGFHNASGALTGVRFYGQAGNLSGTFRLYGIKNS